MMIFRSECCSCHWKNSCRNQHEHYDDLCEDYIAFEEESEYWLEFSYNKFTNGSLDTIQDEYENFEW